MKKALCLLLAIFFCLFAVALAEDEGAQAFPEAGFTLHYPAGYQNLKGMLMPIGGKELSEGSGIYYTYLLYVGLDAGQLAELEADGGEEAVDTLAKNILPLITVLSIDSNRSFTDLNAILGGRLDPQYAREIGRAGDMTFYSYEEPYDAAPDIALADEYASLYGMVDAVLADAEFYEPVSPYDAMAGQSVSFETTDIEGNPVSSADLFAAHEITMVNIWASWCGPCISELEELEALNGRLSEYDCGVVGLLYDGTTQSSVDAAKALLARKGVTYPIILPPEDVDALFVFQSFPTSYFVDREGRIVGEPVVGARVDRYESAIMALLDGRD